MRIVGEIRRDRGTGTKPRWLASSKRWQARYVATDGKRKAVYSTIPGPAGEKACAKLRDELIRATEAGVNPSLMPFGEYLERHVTRSARNWKPETVERYERLVRLHVKPTPQARVRLARLTPDDLDDLYAGAIAGGMSPKGVELLHTLVHGGLAAAMKRGHVMRNAADAVERPRVRRVAPTVPTGEQLRQLVDAAVGSSLEAFVAVLATTGLRLGELLALTWRDVDLDSGRLVIRDPEKDGVPRTVLLSPRVVRALRGHRARIAETRLRRRGAWEERDLVFPGRFGDVANASGVRDELARIATRAGLPPITPRLCRHAVATALLEQGVQMKVVQELLGHRTFKTTADVYSHVSETMQRQAVEAITRAVGE